MGNKEYTYEENKIFHYNARPKKIKYTINNKGCWICTSHSLDKDGYPKIYRDDKFLRISRYIYVKERGEINNNLMVRHKCDNTSCINPEHLELGTARDNSNDMLNRGRSAYGESNAGSKLTECQVIEIINDNRPYCDIAKSYPVTISTISNIKSGRAWKCINRAASGV